MKKYCCFAGHAQIDDYEKVKEKVKNEIIRLIETQEVDHLLQR